MDQSLRRRAQLLVMGSSLLGAVLGTTLGLVTGRAETGRSVAPSPPQHAVSANPGSSRAPASRRAAGQSEAGSDSSSGQPVEPVHRLGQGSSAIKDGKLEAKGPNDRANGRPGKGHSEAGKSNGKGNNK